jgi:uncharacterized protein YndB with AHSA1/START domain
MRIALIVIGLVAALIVIVIAIGSLLPKKHTATRAMEFNRTPEEVFAAIRDFGSYPQWRAEVKRVELLGATQFREHGPHDAVTYDVVEEIAPRRLVTRIADKDLGYSGSWTYEITPSARGAELRITENGEVTNPVFRFMSKFFFSHTASMERYLAALQKKLA